jgi:hypothetical protein
VETTKSKKKHVNHVVGQFNTTYDWGQKQTNMTKQGELENVQNQQDELKHVKVNT